MGILRNSGIGAGAFTVDGNVSKTILIRGASRGEPAMALTLFAYAQNLFNRRNLINVNGVLLSPFFGMSTTALPGRRVEAGARITF